jgi:acetyltransferase-like isoleucine patch superfamily enzyme
LILRNFLGAIYKSYYIKKFAKCAADLRFSPSNSYFTYSKIEIGKNVFINKNVYFSGMITIGNNVMFGPYVFITDGYHKYDEVGKLIGLQGGGVKERVYIDDDVWVGAKVAVMRGVHIFEGTIIGTASVVTKDTPPYCVCVGNPCAPVKVRYTDNELREHFRIMGRSSDDAENMIKLRKEMLLCFNREFDKIRNRLNM